MKSKATVGGHLFLDQLLRDAWPARDPLVMLKVQIAQNVAQKMEKTEAHFVRDKCDF